MIRRILLVVGAVLLVAVAYLTVCVVVERGRVAGKVDAIIASAAPDELGLSAERRRILLTVEDPTFDHNKGIDLTSPGAGMTSLSQSLGKRIFFDPFKPGIRKFKLMALTRFALVPKVDANKRLTAWLATAYLGTVNGKPVSGFDAGARAYFGKRLSMIDDHQFTQLVAMGPAPNKLDPIRHPAENAERVRRINRLLAGECQPTGLRDVDLHGCK
nr:transglycosylase domain-containing protein [uncultured Sphingomonas sp.]